ncbi:SCO-spondin-like isoform X4 [Mytilus galloprovincialis]|uniref:SCO-spondin-like isoform X4 n=1 Tax=Mytilus galloprovincialis TaxID=29158 RepID=UPI003F7C1323
MVDVDGKVGVFFDLDFLKNSQTDSKKTIEDIIIKKSGRLVKNDKLYLVIRDFLVYVKSLKITLETVYVPGPVELPDRDKYLTKVEWSTWSECSKTCGVGIQKRTRNCTEFDIKNHLCDGDEYDEQACQHNPCPALLRAHSSLIIDNEEFNDVLKDSSSDEFHSIAKPLCYIMYRYFLSSDLASHFVKCDVINMININGKVGIFFNLDFLKNSPIDTENIVEDIIKKKSPKVVKTDKLYYLIRDFLVNIKSINITLEMANVPGTVELPDKHKYLTKVEWSNWSTCSSSCGEGIQKRIRYCSDFDIQHHLCDGNELKVQACKSDPCPVDGKWTEWNHWEKCSMSCGMGVKKRKRECTNPSPSFGGQNCIGVHIDNEKCQERDCPIDGMWSEWISWTDCSGSCGGGRKERSRSCSNPSPQYGGRTCVGDKIVSSICNDQPCPVDGSWSEWNAWTDCSLSCDGGITTRQRTCSNPEPTFGGKKCNGNVEESDKCGVEFCPVDGGWTEWTTWSGCSKSCGIGSQDRMRICNDPEPKYGGQNCTGNNLDFKNCDSIPCPIDGQWAGWSEWTDCSLTCGIGKTKRNRTCSDPKPQNGGSSCTGSDDEVKICNIISCPIDGQWTEWNEWSECTISCGKGYKLRNRSCTDPSPQLGGKLCNGNETETDICNTNDCPVDGNWSTWGGWQECSVTCGGGDKTRNRTCTDPIPQYSGEDCHGNDTEVAICNAILCPIDGIWSNWNEWTACSMSCGRGSQSRNRTCSDPEPQYGGTHCFGNKSEEQNCNDDPCPINGNWTEWSDWDECDVLCGGGIQTKYRNCSNPEPQFGGEDCFGNDTEISVCNSQYCPIDGSWTTWSAWDECSVSCGGGIVYRNRSCSNPDPQFGGKDCIENATDTKSCSDDKCPIDGNWTNWSEWSICSKSCGGGLMLRNRTCSNPEPLFGGEDCIGNNTENNHCNTNECPVDGNWTDWSVWTTCSHSCGRGFQSRNRTCSNPVPQFGGNECLGNVTEDDMCNVHNCPVDGNWTKWSEWDNCTQSCGGGFRSRVRNCSDPEPRFEGENCLGNSTEGDICNDHYCPVDGNWTDWSEWNSCSDTCGGGLTFRYRNCSNPEPQFGGIDCIGNGTENYSCNTHYCPVDGSWAEWSEWDNCTDSCGGGLQFRNRTCSDPEPQFGGIDCIGNSVDNNVCNEHECPVDGSWTEWSEWNNCTDVCGGGIKSRNRTCSDPEPQFGGMDCIGNNTESKLCNEHYCPVNGNWTEWSSWNECSATCGVGIKIRERNCSNPEPQYGGDQCFGNSTDSETCNEDPCPIDGNWSGWGEWDECSVSCGGGLKARNRTCSNPVPQFGGNKCQGNDTLISNCAENPCPINGNWTEWSSWNECSVTCGSGIKVRDRNCSNPIPQYGGESCYGNSSNTELCNEDLCPIDGNWSGWSEWERCSVTCGGGFKTRNRTCSNPEPLFGGNNCTGNDTLISNCADNPCPINGNWTEWSSWNECSVTCGGGVIVRDRNCSNPEPQYGGDLCFGNTTNIETCKEFQCPIDGNWSEWSNWEECSVTCGGGLKTRNRNCSNPEPQFGGKYCTGNDTHTLNCAENRCSINGNWSEWSFWNECSVTCGGGIKVRDRNCSNPVPQYGGESCFGNTTDIETCDEVSCPIDGNWSGWSEWDECSITCGGGLMARNRTCSNPEPQYGGKYCTGNDTNISDCADNPCPINGNWTEWSNWNECSFTCGGGMKVRERNCSNPVPQYGGEPCFGNTTNIETCNEDPCPIDGNWSEWSEWEECSVTCGGGIKNRNRTCSNPEPQFGGKYCTGNDTNIYNCADKPCPVNGNWTEWSSWNECSALCGGGLKVRDRECSNPVSQYGGDPCFGNTTNIETCNEDPCPIDGNWSGWSEWEECSVTCGGGLKIRNRTCSNPEPQFGGKYCTGNDTHISHCADNPCPIDGNWTDWSSWNECSVTCGKGLKDRERTCSNPLPQYGGTPCAGNATTSETCNDDPCPIDGQWSHWTEFTICSQTCGGGQQNRNRSCTDPEPQYGGNYCVGVENETNSCNNEPCPINGNWTEWSNWSACPVSCGSGTHTRMRACTNPKPQFGGDICDGNITESQSCNFNHCPIDGQWSPWSEFSDCDQSCGGGIQYKNRSCSNPKPEYGGEQCLGEEIDSNECNTQSCPVNGNWTTWSSWSECPVSCGGSIHTRTRSCSNPKPQYGGDECEGNKTETQICNTQHCPIDGQWSNWSVFTSCSETCGGGDHSRNRSCTEPEPKYGGQQCPGDDNQTQNCNTQPCPINGNWTIWSEWSLCPVSCGGGQHSRSRSCTNPAPMYGGTKCEGDKTENKLCNSQHCPIDGKWTAWGAWSVCSVTCGGGEAARTRSCSDPTPQYNGSNCSGQDKENKACKTNNCPVDGQWSDWMQWSSCTVSCGGGGFQQRKRECNNPAAQYGGKDCNGNNAEVQDCGDFGCPGLLFQPIEEFEGASAVLAKCRIENFTSWQELEIAKNSREMVILQSKGIATSNLGSTVAVSSDIQDTYAEIQLTFNTFSCKDEGTYVCSVDRGYHQSADVVVKTPPVGKPVFDINTEIFGETSVQFSCTGNPGYPKGHLEFWVKFRNHTEYVEYRFHSAVRTVTDKNCRRQETVQVDFHFPMQWNGAKIRCQAPDSEEYTEREIWLISEYYCESVPLFSTVRHPYTCKKYMRCLEDKVDVMECPEGLCYSEDSQTCVYQ